MKASLLLVAVALACALALPLSAPAWAQSCASFPSNDCPAPGVPQGAPSYPCYAGQVKGDWNSMTYHRPSQASYARVGSGPRSDTWCFDSEGDAEGLGFQSA
jgi:hypothetical protein